MIRLKFSLLIGFFLLAGCAENLELKKVRWSELGPVPSRPAGVDLQISALSIGSQTLHFQNQQIDGVSIEDSFYKEISSNRGPEFISYKWASRLPMNLRATLMFMKTKGAVVEKEFFKKHSEYKAADMVEKPKLVVRKAKPQWKFVFESTSESLKAVYVDPFFNITEKFPVGSGFATASATLFPNGPLKSQLQRVLLQELTDNETLSSKKVKVGTRSDQPAISENSQFSFPLEDKRFEQVQVFFYLSKAIEWTEKNLHFKLPFQLEAETSMGFPDKTNAAFYYQKKIRLGDGDETVFSRIPLDPSIVIHESFHAVIEAVAQLPYEGEGGSLNEGFSDYFTAALLENPNLGEVSYKKANYKRTAANATKLSEKNGGLYHDSGIISGLLWSLHKTLGKEVVQQLTWKILIRLTPESQFHDFKQELLEMIGDLSIEQQAQAQKILLSRGWTE